MSPAEEALRVERARRLIDAPPVVPEPWEVETAERCVALARRVLSLPDAVRIHWRFPVPDASRGAHADGVVYLGLPPGTGREELVRVLFHELQHFADHAAGREFDREEWEERADVFSGLMTIHWKAGTVPESEEEDESSTTSRAIPADCRASAADSYMREIQRRVRRLRERLGPVDARSLSVIERLAGQLCVVAGQEEGR